MKGEQKGQKRVNVFCLHEALLVKRKIPYLCSVEYLISGEICTADQSDVISACNIFLH